LSHNGASDAQASVYLWVGVAIGVYVRAKVCKPDYCLYCLIVNMDCSWSDIYLYRGYKSVCKQCYMFNLF